MSEHRILLIESSASLTVDLGRIKIKRDGFADSFVLPQDVAVLCLHHHAIQISVQALRTLAEAGASVMVTNEIHHPCAWLLPQLGNGDLVRRLHQQIALDATSKKDILWQQLVQARLNTQAKNLRALNRKGALRLERLAMDVQPADKTKCEGQGAKHYWAHFFDDFSRKKQGADDAINSRLNFGFAVLRSQIARSLVLAGLNPALGLGHCSMENPFNLADDFIEPYRFVVERFVATSEIGETFDGIARKQILGFVELEVKMNGAGFRLPAAINETIASYVRVLDGRAKQLTLPFDIVVETD